jgi:hypothetical protein
MDLTNERYLIFIQGETWQEYYCKDDDGWLKISARGRKFPMTAEQVLNHLLPAMAGIKPGLTVAVLHVDDPVSHIRKRRGTKDRAPIQARIRKPTSKMT